MDSDSTRSAWSPGDLLNLELGMAGIEYYNE